MKRAFLLICGVAISSFLNGQVTMQNNMPLVVEPNSELNIEVKINKGAITNFAKYQMDLPAGVSAKEGDSKGGTFAFENNRVKVLWPNIQADPEITITMKLLSGSFAGPAKISQKFYYMEGGEKKEADAEPLNVTFNGIKNTSNIGGLEPSKGSPQQQTEKLQAEQLKKDSKDAYQTGLKEQEAAEKKLAEADDAIKKAEALSNEEEKKAALQKASASKQKAENDKAVASKILALAKSLDDNANEIDRLNRATGSAPAPASATGAANTTSPASGSAVVPDNGTVYRVQLGAFAQNPEKILYKHLGTISIVNEGGMYKVLMGKYATREDAVKRRDELVARSFDCFIVTYKNGVRVK